MQSLLSDKLSYLTIKPERASAFFRLMDQRYRRVATIITTNLDLPDWYAPFDGPSLRSPDLRATPPASSARGASMN